MAKFALWLLLAAWLVMVLAWGALHAWIVPRIGELRPRLETEASRAMGVPVRIGSIDVLTEGFIPSFELRQVALLDPAGRTALLLPRVLASLSPRSLLALGFEQLYIDRPELDVRRAPDGRIYVAGLDLSRAGGGAGGGQAADWFFEQPEFVIRNGTLRWHDEMRGAPPLALQQVDLVVRNGARRHALRVDATPPAAWGNRFTLQGVFRQRLLSVHAGRWQDWDGQLHGDFSRVDVTELGRYADVGVKLSHGRGTVRAWADVSRGELVGGTADLRLEDVDATLGPKLEPLALASLSGRLGGKRLEGGFEFETSGLQFETREGQRWPGGNVSLRWLDAQGNKPSQGELRADRLDLLALGQLASRLPLSPATHQVLAAYAPRGLVEMLQATWTGPLEKLRSYDARIRARGLEVAAQPPRPAASGQPAQGGTPGFHNASVDLELSQAGGKGRLQLQRGTLDLPGVFEDPLVTVDALSADLQWKIDGDAISASIGNLKFANADAQADLQASWKTGSGAHRFPGILDLQASIPRADGARVWRYLPLGVPKEARDYVRESVVSGQASGGKVRVRGDLRDFPFRDPRQGEFRISTEVRNTTYAYVPRSATRNGPAWPALTQMSGELVFERAGMVVKGASGRILGAQGLQFKADARIPDLDTSVVAVTSEIKGPLPEALSVVNGSPISELVSQSLSRATATGPAEVRLKLDLPIATLDKSRIQGSVVLPGNDVQFTPDIPLLTRARGSVNFNERGFTLSGIQARALGGEVRIDGGTRPAPGARAETWVQVRAQGTASAEGLRQARELGQAARLAREASGSAAYAVTVQVRRGVPEVAVSTTLQGLAINLPAPLGKSAEQSLPLRFETALTRESLSLPSGSPRLQDQLSLDIGRIAQLSYLRELSGPDPHVVRGTVALGLAPGESVGLPEQGVAASVNLGVVNLDRWSELLAAGAPSRNGPAPGAAPIPPAGGAAFQAYMPTVIALRARELVFDGRSLHNVVVGGSREGGLWRANVDGAELNGYVEYRQASAGPARVYARLSRLALAAQAAREVETLLDEQPSALPALDIVVDDFDLKGRKLGRLEVDAQNRGSGAQREWRLAKLNLVLPEATFSANGNWAVLNAQSAQVPGARGARPPERMRTAMKFRLDVADSGQLLARFGMKDVVRRGKGRMEGQVAWVGSPLSLNYASMDGAFNVNMEGGQFLKADPGLAKLLGVLSLQSLPRRFALDFRDVFSEGFAFDFVRGDITIQDGIAATNNLQMKGVNAAVLMEGKADLARETQDIKVVVVPEINAGTASLVAGVINPAIGLGSFLAQLVLRQPLIRAATQEFHVGGTWADPQVTRTPRGAPTEAAAAESRPVN